MRWVRIGEDGPNGHYIYGKPALIGYRAKVYRTVAWRLRPCAAISAAQEKYQTEKRRDRAARNRRARRVERMRACV